MLKCAKVVLRVTVQELDDSFEHVVNNALEQFSEQHPGVEEISCQVDRLGTLAFALIIFYRKNEKRREEPPWDPS